MVDPPFHIELRRSPHVQQELTQIVKMRGLLLDIWSHIVLNGILPVGDPNVSVR